MVSEVNSGFFYKTAEERDKLVNAERKFIENRVEKLIELKKKVCDGTDKTFVVINQKVCWLYLFMITFIHFRRFLSYLLRSSYNYFESFVIDTSFLGFCNFEKIGALQKIPNAD